MRRRTFAALVSGFATSINRQLCSQTSNGSNHDLPFQVQTFPSAVAYVSKPRLNTDLRRATFLLRGNRGAGTAFVVGRSFKDAEHHGKLTLVSCAHVFDQIDAEFAQLIVRTKAGAASLPIRVRGAEGRLWKRHPAADVAAMDIALSADLLPAVLPSSLLATPELMDKLDIGPPEELHCLGYPYGDRPDLSGFPVVVNGAMASQPQASTLGEVPQFLFGAHAYPGYSGGPVYFVDRNRPERQLIVGMIKGSATPSQAGTGEKPGEERQSLALGIVIPAWYIRETLHLLPQETLPLEYRNEENLARLRDVR